MFHETVNFLIGGELDRVATDDLYLLFFGAKCPRDQDTANLLAVAQ